MNINLLPLFNRINSLCIWININTKKEIIIIFNGRNKEYRISIYNKNKEKYYTNTINLLKNDKIIKFEMESLATILQHLKDNHNEL